MLFYFFKWAYMYAAEHVKPIYDEFFILLCQLTQHVEQSFSWPMVTFVWKWGCAKCSFLQSPHLGGQNGQFLSSTKLLKPNWAKKKKSAVSPT